METTFSPERSFLSLSLLSSSLPLPSRQGRHKGDPLQHGPEGGPHWPVQEEGVSRRHGEDGLRRRPAGDPLPDRAAAGQRQGRQRGDGQQTVASSSGPGDSQAGVWCSLDKGFLFTSSNGSLELCFYLWFCLTLTLLRDLADPRLTCLEKELPQHAFLAPGMQRTTSLWVSCITCVLQADLLQESLESL